MSYFQPWQSYRQVSMHTASPGQLVSMLYDGAISFLEKALAGFQFDDPLQFNSTISNNVLRAQNIIGELNASLDIERGGELATTLRRLYHYMDSRLSESNLRKTRDGIEETMRHLAVLRDAWREMLTQHNAPTTSAKTLSACV